MANSEPAYLFDGLINEKSDNCLKCWLSNRSHPFRPRRADLLMGYSIAKRNRCSHLLAFLECWLPAWKGTVSRVHLDGVASLAESEITC
jgi:hypothetical protein